MAGASAWRRLNLRPAKIRPSAASSSTAGRSSRATPSGAWGARQDAASFADAAYNAHATGVVVGNRYIQPAPGCWSFEAEDSLAALTRLASWNRARFSGVMVAVTGSVGKTTARQMIYSVLQVSGSGVTSPKNYNNHIGVPLSLLGLGAGTVCRARNGGQPAGRDRR